jgi:hypothetical protein
MHDCVITGDASTWHTFHQHLHDIGIVCEYIESKWLVSATKINNRQSAEQLMAQKRATM